MRQEIERAGGREVCFLAGVTSDRRIVHPRAVSRGNHLAVLAAARDAEAGEILLHNHPSGLLEPSEADLALAARVYEEGLGTGIVDNAASRLYVVVEPPALRTRARLDPDEVEGLLAPGGSLSGRFEGYEDRPAQRQMLRAVVDRYNEGGVAVVEAGTGTGKSLAYLLPAALWALRNGERTVVSTNTINLQEQLVGKDLPLVRELVGGELRWALVKGRGNYVSIRRLHLAVQTGPTLFEEDREAELAGLLEWSRTTSEGSLSDLAVPVSDDVWEEVRSDGDICMGARCPHFQACFYQRSRRVAAAAEILVANHALLLADVSVRSSTDNWGQSAVLPPYRHVVLDEGHNVEDAATSHLGAEVTRTGLFRALDRLDRSGRGVLLAVEEALLGAPPGGEAGTLLEQVKGRLRPALVRSREALTSFFDALEPHLPEGDEEPLRLGRGDPRDPSNRPEILERLDRLTAAFSRLRREVEGLRLGIEEDEPLRDRLDGRLLDLQSIERRLASGERGLALVLDPDRSGSAFVRWIEARGRPGGPLRNVLLAAAPVEPGALLRTSLFDRVETAVVTSATLPIGGTDFRFVRGRLGLDEAGGRVVKAESEERAAEFAFSDVEAALHPDATEEAIQVTETLLASPFDYGSQTLFCVPSDLPGHDAGAAFQEATARVVQDFAQITGGGLFVLFTSHRALRTVGRLLREAGVDREWPLFIHGEAPRVRLLRDFVAAERGILLGTSSFWEGVDVPGDPLRGLVLQKLPFRVPTEPITQARMEAIEARGENPFGAYLLPLAALRLKQGFGRLVRSRADKGGIVLLDSRILTRSYGRVLLRALPGAPLKKGPWQEVRRGLSDFYGG
ncbi:MAG: helicase C-terminal domain-containing protein [Gemmatimonadota bacterium]